MYATDFPMGMAQPYSRPPGSFTANLTVAAEVKAFEARDNEIWHPKNLTLISTA